MHFLTIKYAFVNKLIMQFLTSNKALIHKFNTNLIIKTFINESAY